MLGAVTITGWKLLLFVSISSGSMMPPNRNLGVLTIKEEKRKRSVNHGNILFLVLKIMSSFLLKDSWEIDRKSSAGIKFHHLTTLKG